MPSYRRARDGTAYFFTVVTWQRQPILCEEPSRRVLREVIQELQLSPSGSRLCQPILSKPDKTEIFAANRCQPLSIAKFSL